MKIFQAIGLLVAIFGLKFVLMWTVFRAFEGALVALFTTFGSMMGAVGSSIPPAL